MDYSVISLINAQWVLQNDVHMYLQLDMAN